MKTRWVGLAGLGVVAALAVVLVYWYIFRDDSVTITERDVAQARLKLQGGASTPKMTPPRPVDRNARVRLAIGSLGLPGQEENRRLSDLLTAQLTGTQGLDLVDRASLDKVLKELELSAAGIGRAKDAVRVGNLLKADWFLLGTGTALTNRPNAVVARIVDVQTGVMLDVGLVQNDGNPVTLAAGLAGFVRDCRQNAGESSGRVYLAIGSFQDLSFNNRQEKFLSELHAFLTSAYRGTKVALVEREYVNALLNEVRLDLAGLTEESASSAAPRMQSAFWLLDGFYQSYETTTFQVEVELNVQRVFGNNTRVVIKEPSLEAAVQKIKQTVDQVMEKAPPLIAPTRNAELRLQLATGRDLSKFDPWMMSWSAPPYEDLDPAQLARRKRNLEEAIRAFETVLLFEPTNREAKLYLGTLVRRVPLLRNQEGWDYYRQVIDEGVDDIWDNRARGALGIAFGPIPPTERARWFRGAAAAAQNARAKSFYAAKADTTESTLAAKTQSPSDRYAAADQALFSGLESWVKQMQSNKPFPEDLNFSFNQFTNTLRTNQAAAADAVAAVLPKLKERYPEFEPYFLAAIVSYQVATNSPVIGMFENSFDQAVSNLEKLPRPKQYFWEVNNQALGWCAKAGLGGLAVKIVLATRQVARKGLAEELDDVQKLTLGFGYMRVEQLARSAGRVRGV